MLHAFPRISTLLVAFGIVVCDADVTRAAESSVETSPRLARLAQELQGGKREALALFWKEIHGQAPLVESIPVDARQRRVTFLWKGSNDTRRVTVMGGLPGANFLKQMTHLPGTDVWYLTEAHSTEARFQYAFQINGPESVVMEQSAITTQMQRNPPRVDPLNTNEYAGWSYVELPDAPPQPWIHQREGVPEGRKIQMTFKSQMLAAEYPLSIYTPPGYSQDGKRCWLMLAFDGGFRRMDVTLDNLLGAEKIPPVVVVGIQNLSSQSRMRDLNCSDPFANFLARELVSWARKTYRAYDDAAHTIVGASASAARWLPGVG
jgi:hypothetical protein